MAVAMDVYRETVPSGIDDEGNYSLGEVERLDFRLLLDLRTPVFYEGEILILDEGGREIGFPGRKPSKWDVDVVEVSSLEEAATLSHQVMYPKPEPEED